MKRGPLAWCAIVVPVWITFVLCTHWEPVLRDGWGHVQWHRTFSTTPANVWRFAHESYVHNNPRLGQVLTLLVYTPGPWHEIFTPLVELALFYLLTLHALGRRPSFRRADDALMFATILAMVALTAPLIGQMLFYRPFTGNYVFSFVIGLAFLAPYRLHAEAVTPRPRSWIPIMLVLGYATGLCNEHTGPTFVALTVFAILAVWRRGERPSAWMIAGLVGVVAGFIALYVAPAQSIRYNALATSTSLLGRVSARSSRENLRIVVGAYAATWKLVVWPVLAYVGWRITKRADLSRPRRITAVTMLLASLAIGVTLLVSPKQGGRLEFASVCLFCTGLASLVLPFIQTTATRVCAGLAAAIAIAYLLYSVLATYHEVGGEFRTRFEAISSAPPRSRVTVSPYTLPRSRWFLGEDFAADSLRFGLAWNRNLEGIELDRPAEGNQDPGGL
jgi:hypothetical protein